MKEAHFKTKRKLQQSFISDFVTLQRGLGGSHGESGECSRSSRGEAGRGGDGEGAAPHVITCMQSIMFTCQGNNLQLIM